jgi:Tol biopolymer transport system component
MFNYKLLRSFFAGLAISAVCIISCSKSDSPNGPGDEGDYLGQTPPGKQFVRFAPNIVPEAMYNSVTVSPDGQEIYWAASNGIKVTKKQDGRWTTPTIVSFSGKSTEEFYDDAPVISPDNKRLYFTSLRPCGSLQSGRWYGWYAERTTNGWSEPQPLPEVINSGTIHWAVTLSNSGTLYFYNMTGGHSRIYLSKLTNGTYTTTEPLTVINDFADACAPFIAPDESYIIFTKLIHIQVGQWSYAPDGYYISFKGRDGQWQTPQKLTQFPDGESTFVTRDGKYIFCKGWWASAQIIEDYRPKN